MLNQDSKDVLKLGCAALAFHKSLIGISQLNALEELEKNNSISRLRPAKALYTYYAVYHLFCMCILISPQKYLEGLKITAPNNYGEWTYEQINNKSERAEIWNRFRDYESDWATSITHSDIRHFCEKLRENKAKIKKYPKYLQVLYENFVKDVGDTSKCLPGLFEKLNYVRDRTIYRPSYSTYKIYGNEYRLMQTSKNLKAEINSLPTSEELYTVLSKVYEGVLSLNKYECLDIMFPIWCSDVYEKVTYYGFSNEHINRLIDNECAWNYDGVMITLPTYVVHMLELENIDYVIKYVSKYWRPLEEASPIRRRNIENPC